MVKGIAKRIVIVKSPRQSIFEQAIFIMKDEAYTKGGLSAEKILNEASSIADKYLSPQCKKIASLKFYIVLSAAAGGAVVGMLWALSGIFA